MEYLVIFLLLTTFFGIVGMILACVPFKRIYTSFIKLKQKKNIRTFSKVKIQKHEPNLRHAGLFNFNLNTLAKPEFSLEKNTPPSKDLFTILYLLPTNHAYYQGSVVWHTLIEQKLVYGKMRIFHAYDNNSSHQKLLFSVAGATEPGHLHQENLEGKHISGLCFFMHHNGSSRMSENFQKMLETAQQMRERLGGMLCNDRQEPLNKVIIAQYQQQFSSALLS